MVVHRSELESSLYVSNNPSVQHRDSRCVFDHDVQEKAEQALLISNLLYKHHFDDSRRYLNYLHLFTTRQRIFRRQYADFIRCLPFTKGKKYIFPSLLHDSMF